METEVKIRLADPQAFKSRLVEAGFYVSVARALEINDLYDTPDRSLRRQGMLLRLRRVGDESKITWKGAGVAGPHKSRPELETSIGSFEVLAEILKQLGFERIFRYEKFRTEYENGREHSVVTVDETPIGNYIEIEGEPEWIDGTARQLGFSANDYILASYGQLYLDHCRQHGLEPGDMIFTSSFSEQNGGNT
jgi:adenylate cyclase class 2